ncbi:hypothetical protein [Rickettsia endosymbiont of Orchestes rusci]|uniref:hypothetical protein n=1 Tax=Rickettsia endosymbiont of Orchestes rusci TaxID=3066250 RepID=UPI00313B9E53
MTRLDFNRILKYYDKNNGVMITLNMLLNQALSYEKSTEPLRKYLGASRLGVPCSRALQYEYLKAINGDIRIVDDGNHIRNFEIGYLFERLMIDWLKLSGFKLLTHDEQGKQLGFAVADGKIAGHIDGVITDVPIDIKDLNRENKDLKISCPMLWETKSMNNKNWRETFTKGLVLSKPVYAAQIALYQAYMEETICGISKNPCLFTAINKDTAEIYVELIPFDAELAQRMSDKAVNIIKATEAGETLPRGFSSKEVFDCKICPYQSKCWGD